jgi:peptide/nickel transport system permease protein
MQFQKTKARAAWDQGAGAAVLTLRRHPLLLVGLLVLLVLALLGALAPWMAGDPAHIDPAQRLRPPSRAFWFGTDHLGRDVFARTVHGARVSLSVAMSVSVMATTIGLIIGLAAGFVPWIELVVMRLMEGLMAIPAILLAIALAALTKAGVVMVIVAIVITEIPRVVRLVRSVVLSARETLYVEAAIASGSRLPKILWRHVLPATMPPLAVQATYIAAAAILIEAALSFLGAGTPPEIPTWGNMIASSRLYLGLAPWTVFCPGLALATAVLAINLIGDGLRDMLDPRLARRLG